MSVRMRNLPFPNPSPPWGGWLAQRAGWGSPRLRHPSPMRPHRLALPMKGREGDGMTQPTLRYRQAVQWRADGSEPIERATPHEAAIGLSFNGRPHTVLMGTPADLSDLTIGFAVTEGIMTFEEIEAVHVEEAEQGFL